MSKTIINKTIKNNNVNLHYIENRNNSSNKWFLFIPGAINSAEQIEEDLQKAEFNYFILSLRGRGKSDSPDTGYTLKDQASDINSFLKTLDKNINLSVFAHSVGVPISIVALSENIININNFIMCEFAPFYPPFDKNWADSLIKQKVESISTIAINGLVKDAFYKDVTLELQKITSKLYLMTGTNQFSALRSKEKDALKKLFPFLIIKEIEAGHDPLNENNPEVLNYLKEL